MELAEGQTISSDNRIVELLELLTNNQMNAQAEQVKQLCGYAVSYTHLTLPTKRIV